MPAPDFLCIGAQKAGTSWLDAMLRQHPDVFLPPMKEVHFYDFIYLPENRRWIRAGFGKRRAAARPLARLAALPRAWVRTWRGGPPLQRTVGHETAYFTRLAALPRRKDAWYAAVFDHPDAAGRLTGEITPAYALLPARGVARVRATNPAMKIILLLRDPVDRALSHLRMAVYRRQQPRIDPAFLAANPSLLAKALAHSGYRANLARWEAAFPSGQLLCLPFAAIRSTPDRLMAEVEAFLGLAPCAYRGLRYTVHRSAPAEIDPAVRALFEERLAEERAFLAARFGADDAG